MKTYNLIILAALLCVFSFTPPSTRKVSAEGTGHVDTSSVNGLSCDAKVYYGVQHCTDNGVSLMVVDLKDSHVSVQTVLSSRNGVECNSVNYKGPITQGRDPGSNCDPLYPFETMLTMLKRYTASGAVAAINTDYFAHDANHPTTGDHGAEGLAVSNGYRRDGKELHNDTDGNATKRSSLAFSKAKPIVGLIGKPTSESQIDVQGAYYNVVGGGPMIVRSRQALDNNACTAEGLSIANNCTPSNQSAAGLTADGKLILITTQQDAAGTARYLVNNYAVDSAVKFDGGGSARMAWLDSNGQPQSWGATGEDRPVAEGLLIFSGKICPSINDWKGEYWNNLDFSGDPALCRNDGSVDFNWGSGGPGSGIGNDNFAARWTRNWTFAAGRYRFHLRGDDGIRLWVDGNQLINQWKDQGRTEYTADIDLSAGSHSLKVEYYERGGDANVALWWDTLSIGSGNLALNRPAYATSQESATFTAAKGNDGNIGTRWSSQWSATARDEWWWTDLGTQTFDRIVVRWETAYASQHCIAWSDDGIHFTGSCFSINAPGAYAYNVGSHTARYVGMLMRQRAPCCGNYSLWEFEAYRTVNVASAQTEATEANLMEATPDGDQVTLTLPEAETGNKLFLPLVQR